MRGMMAAAVLALGLGTSGAALAQSLAWQVTEVSGGVTIRHGSEERPATRGATLAPGDVIATAAGGRAVMVHDKDFVTLASRSRATVPGAEAQATGFTKLLQDLGNAVYKIEKRGVPHFGVTTPYLAAVVKGTTFSITVDDRGSTLQVVEGAVEVSTPDGGARDLILPAGIASVGAGDRFRLTVRGDHERVIDSPARPAAANATPAAAARPAAAVTSAAPAPAAAPASEMPATGGDVIAVPVASRPVDMAAFTGGLVSGTAGFTALTAVVTQTAKASPATPTASSQPTVIAAAATVPAAPVATGAAAATTPTAPATTVATTPAAPAVTAPPIAAPATPPTPAPLPTAPLPAPTPPVPPTAPLPTPPTAAPPAGPAGIIGAITNAVTTIVSGATQAVTPIVTPAPTTVVTTAGLVSTVTPVIGTVLPTAKSTTDNSGDDSSGNDGNHFGWTKGNGNSGKVKG